MVVGSESLARPWRWQVQYLGLLGWLVAIPILFQVFPSGAQIDLYVLAGLAFTGTVESLYRRGGVGRSRALRRAMRRAPKQELVGVVRRAADDTFAAPYPIAVQRPHKHQPGFRCLSARPFDLELDDGRRVRVEPQVAVLEASEEQVPFGARLAVAGATTGTSSYREVNRAPRGTVEEPLILRVLEAGQSSS